MISTQVLVPQCSLFNTPSTLLPPSSSPSLHHSSGPAYNNWNLSPHWPCSLSVSLTMMMSVKCTAEMLDSNFPKCEPQENRGTQAVWLARCDNCKVNSLYYWHTNTRLINSLPSIGLIYITFTFIHLADAFIQSDYQGRALHKVTEHNNEIAPNIVGSQIMKHTLWKAKKCQWEET